MTLLPGIRAVIFDIYGTLLSSAAGEIHPDPLLAEAIEQLHAESPHPYPEVDIREIHARMHPHLLAGEIEHLALEHERLMNPVAPMPGAAEVLRALSRQGMALGLISNAQFYTVPILEACLGTSLANAGIDADLCCFSYLERRAKPDPHLFQIIRAKLAERGIPAGTALYVGNDARNDIDPAKATGFRTALFAGDERSLRLRGRTLDECGADLIVTDLRQLVE